jgi:hypothetical protein
MNYKKYLLQSAYDLQSRLSQQVQRNFLYDFKERDEKQTDASAEPGSRQPSSSTLLHGGRHYEYAVHSTAYFFAEFLAQLEVIRRNMVFITGCAWHEAAIATQGVEEDPHSALGHTRAHTHTHTHKLP